MQYLQLLSDLSDLPDQQGSQGISEEPGPAIESAFDRWNPSNLSYFDLYLDKSYGESEIVIVEKNTYFRSVILFIERLRDVAAIKGSAIVKANINTTLRDTALLWYIIELSNLKKLGLRVGNNIKE